MEIVQFLLEFTAATVVISGIAPLIFWRRVNRHELTTAVEQEVTGMKVPVQKDSLFL
jgi:hypothetical protein